VSYAYSMQLKLTFDYARYPLDTQELYMAFEDIESPMHTLLLVADPGTNYAPNVNVISFEITGVVARTLTDLQRTTYGIKGAPQTFSRAELGISLYRNPIYFTLRVLPPALVTLSVAALVLLIDPMAVETRLGVAITGLLTLVLMGLGFQEKIPNVAQLTVDDWFFNWCYFILLLVVVECVFISAYVQKVGKLLLHAELGTNELFEGVFNESWERRKLIVKNWWNKLRGKPQLLRSEFEEYSTTTPFKKFGDEEPVDVELLVQDNKERAKRFIHLKLKAAKRLDYILASFILLLATVGTVLVIIMAKYA